MKTGFISKYKNFQQDPLAGRSSLLFSSVKSLSFSLSNLFDHDTGRSKAATATPSCAEVPIVAFSSIRGRVIEHDLRLPPHLLSLSLHKAIRGELERLFLDKVISNLGLCVSVYDIKSVEGGFIFPGDGASTYKVKFRLVMFRPFVGEVLIGKIDSSSESGLKVSLGFFNDIYIPRHLLQQPCTLGKDGLWTWDLENGSSLSLDMDEEIRFRVSNVKYNPIPVTQDENAKPFVPMEITGDIYGDALGLVSWWEE